MIKNFVIEIIGTLQPQEQSEFHLFLQSPFFNRGRNSIILVQLFEILVEAVQGGTIEELEKEQVFESLYPNKSLVEGKVDKLTTELKSLLQVFLLTSRYLSEENEPQQLLNWTREIRLRGIVDKYQLALEKTKNQAKKQPYESIDNHLFLHLVAIEEHEWNSTFNKSKGDLNIPELLRHLEHYYYSQKTEMLNRLLLQQKQAMLPNAASQFSNNAWDIPKNLFSENALLNISWEVHSLLKEDVPKTEGFYHLLSTIQNLEHKINPETIAQFYTYLRNICVLLIDVGYVEFFAVLHEIQKDNLERGYFYFQGKISPHAYINITQVATNVKAFEWAKHFVERHKDIIIGENETQDFYQMNRAICLFYEKKYAEALEMIPFGSTYSLYHLMAKRLELKIYYEMRSDLLDFKIDAFKMFVSRAGQKLLSKNMHELFVNFINLLRQLNQSSGFRDKKRSQILINRINGKKRLAERPWLLEKARELGERKF